MVVEGKLKPSSDTPTHLELYKTFKEIKAIAHTHSTYATSFAQANKEIEILGTTAADYFYENIQVTRALRNDEMDEYELNTGHTVEYNIEYNFFPMFLEELAICP